MFGIEEEFEEYGFKRGRIQGAVVGFIVGALVGGFIALKWFV